MIIYHAYFTVCQRSKLAKEQCDQKKSPKLPKNDSTIKMIDFDTFTKIA